MMKTPKSGFTSKGMQYHPTKGWRKHSQKTSLLAFKGYEKIDKLISRGLSKIS